MLLITVLPIIVFVVPKSGVVVTGDPVTGPVGLSTNPTAGPSGFTFAIASLVVPSYQFPELVSLHFSTATLRHLDFAWHQ